MDLYGFYTGKIFNVYEYLGAHKENRGYVFRVFAPNAANVSLIGDFNNWQEWDMKKINDGNFFEIYVEDAKDGMKYLHRIYNKYGGYTDHCDIYGFGMELRPDYKSVLNDLSSYRFKDKKWINDRTTCKDKPLNIYEVHIGSWCRKDDNSWYRYDEIADKLISYVKETGYNYIEFLPLSEHPCDESWGYQDTGFFSPTSRYGTANQLMQLVDKCHQNNIGVIMDFVPVHFAVDGYGIKNYDGTALYEYPHSDVGISEWGSCNFMHSRGEVRSFLQSCAYYWLKEFHFDGIRMDAISRIIYWQGEENRGVNECGVEFIKIMNKGLKEYFPNCILIAEAQQIILMLQNLLRCWSFLNFMIFSFSLCCLKLIITFSTSNSRISSSSLSKSTFTPFGGKFGTSCMKASSFRRLGLLIKNMFFCSFFLSLKSQPFLDDWLFIYINRIASVIFIMGKIKNACE